MTAAKPVSKSEITLSREISPQKYHRCCRAPTQRGELALTTAAAPVPAGLESF
jgi:hypothetical protein